MGKRAFKKRMPRRGETGLLMMIRAVGLVTLICAVLTVTTFWQSQDLSAQRIGASIDRVVHELNFS